MVFSEKLRLNQTVITVELSPPNGTDASFMLKTAHGLKGLVDAINVPDCQLSLLKMSSLAASKLIQDETGIEAIWQLTCRDRNLIALQADVLGAYALGIKNVLALTGDPVQIGDQRKRAKQVFHLESTRLLNLLQQLNADQDACDNALKKSGTQLTIGAAINPYKLYNRAQQMRLQRKIEQQVDFFQTQPVYHTAIVKETRERIAQAADAIGYPEPSLIVGIIPPKTAEMARRLNETIVGINIPDTLIDSLARSTSPIEESYAFCADLIDSVKSQVNGFHFMPVGTAGKVKNLIQQCGFTAVSVT
ncbi:MAG: methylenetetrahydrofolate reductase [Cyanobacteria bacterium P01_H01_bin.74]